MKIRINDNIIDIRQFIMKVNYHGVDANNDFVIIAMFKDNGH